MSADGSQTQTPKSRSVTTDNTSATDSPRVAGAADAMFETRYSNSWHGVRLRTSETTGGPGSVNEARALRRELKNTGYEIFIGILSVLSIVNLVLLYAIQDDGLDTVLWVMNAILSGIFLADFTYRLFTAESKTHYFFRMFGWADLLASLPFQQVKILRVFRLVRVFRLLRAYGLKNIARSLLQDRASSALLTLLLMGILVLEFGSLEMLHVEQNAPAPTSRQPPTPSGTPSSRSRPSATATATPSPTRDGWSARSSSSSASASSARSPATWRTSSSPRRRSTGRRATAGRRRRRAAQRRPAQGADGPATGGDGRDQPAPSGRPTLTRTAGRHPDSPNFATGGSRPDPTDQCELGRTRAERPPAEGVSLPLDSPGSTRRQSIAFALDNDTWRRDDATQRRRGGSGRFHASDGVVTAYNPSSGPARWRVRLIRVAM